MKMLPKRFRGDHAMWAIFLGRLSALVVILSLSSASAAYGEALRVSGKGKSGSAQGDAFAAQADDPSAIFYNPAGMTQLKRVQFSTSLQLVGGFFDYKSPSGQKFRSDLDGSIATPPTPSKQLYHNRQLGETLTQS